MSEKKIEIPCIIKAVGAKEVEDKARQDMKVDDPELSSGKRIVEDAIKKDGEEQEDVRG